MEVARVSMSEEGAAKAAQRQGHVDFFFNHESAAQH